MDNLNKTISFVLGLVVVLVFFAVISGRINLKGRLPFIAGSTTPTPTKSPVITPIPTSGLTINQPSGSYNNNNNQTKPPKTIPSTGSPTLLFPILISALSGGFMLRRTKKN